MAWLSRAMSQSTTSEVAMTPFQQRIAANADPTRGAAGGRRNF